MSRHMPPSGFPTAENLRLTLQTALNPSALEVIDETSLHAGHAGAQGRSSGTHFRVRIGGPQLDSLSRVAAHRLVYDALRSYMEGGLHALAIERIPSHTL
jgi:BolA family transcriptional regulator, general stress-responsive regulator